MKTNRKWAQSQILPCWTDAWNPHQHFVRLVELRELLEILKSAYVFSVLYDSNDGAGTSALIGIECMREML